MRNLHEELCTFVTRFLSVFLGMKNFWDKSSKKNQNKHFVFTENFPPKTVPYVR